jgi:hypothetical protein
VIYVTEQVKVDQAEQGGSSDAVMRLAQRVAQCGSMWLNVAECGSNGPGDA